MSYVTKLSLSDQLPLTCSRSGTCCHGKMVWLNPWELACLSEAKGLNPREFRDTFCEFGGIRLRFDGAMGWKNQKACSQYSEGVGCSVHMGRPLVCRLFPLGRQRQGEVLNYIHQGREFPCMDGCPEVLQLPKLSVAEYIASQATEIYESAHDEYLTLMQHLADGAFALLLESGLAAAGDRQTLKIWREMGRSEPEKLVTEMGQDWLDALMLPELTLGLKDPKVFCNLHYERLQHKAQASFGALDNFGAMRQASGLMMGLALHLGRGLGANPAQMVEHWIKTAKTHGAKE